MRFTRAKVPHMNQYESTWWTRYLVPEARADLIDHPDGRLHGKYCRLFHISFSVFLVLLDILKRWYPNWRKYATSCTVGKPVSHIELRLLGSIFYLTADGSHYTISTITNISESLFFYEVDCRYELHQGSVYLHVEKRRRIPTCGRRLHSQGTPRAAALEAWTASILRGIDALPCIKSNMFKGKEGFCSIAYEVVCNCRNFIQLVSVGHPGT